MSDQKDKYFHRQQNRFIKSGPRKEVNQSIEVKNSFSLSQSKEEQSSSINKIEIVAEEKTPYSFTAGLQENLRKWVACTRGDLEALLGNKILRQQLKKQQKRLTKVRNDNKLNVETDTELSIVAFNNLLTSVDEYVNEVNKEKSQKSVSKSTVRLNQEKEIARQLKTIDQQMEINNFASVKSVIQILLKKFGKDELLQDKLGYLNYVLALNEQLERESSILKDLSNYVEKLSLVDVTPENINPSALSLKNLKKETTIALNKENKKQEPNERVIALVTQVDKIGANLSSFIDSKIEKKVEAKSKRELELEKQLIEKSKSSEFFEEAARFSRQLLEKTSQSKDELYKELENLKKNKKKATQAPYSLLLKIYENINVQKREVNESNLYFKACSQLYLRKNLNSENLLIEIKKIDEKYAANQLLAALKPNIDILVNNVQERQRSTKEVSSIEVELKKSRLEIQKLQKVIEDQKSRSIVEPSAQVEKVEKVDKKKELQQKRAKQAERIKQEKEEKELEKSLDNIFNNLGEKKWKIAKNSINVFLKKYEESTSPNVIRYLQSFNTILVLLQDSETSEGKAAQLQKREKTNLVSFEKQKESLAEKCRQSEQFEAAVRNLIEISSQQSKAVKKYFDDLRKDRKKIVQERYQLLNKLEEPLFAWRNKQQQPEVFENKNMSLSLSLSATENEQEKLKQQREELMFSLNNERERNSQLESKLKESGKSGEISKDADQLLNLVKRIQKGGEWWKFFPKNLKNSNFKQIYALLEKYRENELAIQRYLVNEELFKEEGDTVNNAIDSCITLVQSSQNWLSQQSWQKRLASYRGNKSCDKLITCLRELTSKANIKMEEQRKNYTKGIAAYEGQIQKLTNMINELQKKRDSWTEKSSRVEDSSSKKSIDLKSSRKNSKSKDKEAQVKDAMQEYVQQEKNMLSRIDELEKEKHSLEMRALQFENELSQTEKKMEQQRIQFENLRYANERIRLEQISKINELEGEIEISEGRRIELQQKLQAQVNAFNEIQNELTNKLQQFQARQQLHQEDFKKQQREIAAAIELQFSNELNYHREMYGELSKQLQNSKEKEAKALFELQALQKSTQILEKKYFADLAIYQSQLNDVKNSNSSSNEKVYKSQSSPPGKQQQHLEKMVNNSSYSIELATSNMYVESEQLSHIQKVEVIDHKPPGLQNNEIIQLRHEIERLHAQIIENQKQKAFEIENEVIMALKNQQSDFNEFLKRFEAQKYQFFMKEILPKKLEEQLSNKTVSTSNYEFMHTQWIVNEFPRLYEERHSKQCRYANVDVDALLKNRLQESQQGQIKTLKSEWEKETAQKVEASLFEFQQNALPSIIQQIRLQCEEEKQKQLEVKIWEMQSFWRKVVEDEKAHLISSYQAENKVSSVALEPQGLQLLQLVQRQKNKWVVDTLLKKHLQQWQQRKAEELLIVNRDIDHYWSTVVIPQKEQEWHAVKQNEFAELRVKLIEENDRQWTRKVNEIILPQALSEQQTKVKLLSQPALNPVDIIEDWKAANLPLIIQAERKFAIESFIQIDLPLIIDQQKRNWLTLQGSDAGVVLQQERVRWQQEKRREIEFLSASFDVKINEILQIEHAEWERLKIIEIEKVLAEQHKIWTTSQPNIQEILKSEHQHWQLVKLQEIRRVELEFETRLNQIQRKLNAQIIDYQEKFMKEQSKISEAEATSIARWKAKELPLLLAKQREQGIQEFKAKELPKILEQQYSQWQTVDLIRLLHTEKNQYIINNIISQNNKDWEKKISDKTLQIRKEYELELANQRQHFQSEKTKIVSSLAVSKAPQIPVETYAEWEKQKEAEWNERVKSIQNYWETVIIPEREDYWRREQAVYVDELIKNKIADVETTYQDEIIPNIIKEEKQKIEKQHAYLIESQAATFELQLKKLKTESTSSNSKIQQLLSQIADHESKARDYRIKYEQAQSKVSSLLNEHETSMKRTLEDSHRLNEEVTRSRWVEKQTDELRKIIEMQKAEVAKLTAAVRESERLKLENLSLQQANGNLQKSKWQQINDLRVNYQSKILEITSERNILQSKMIHFEGARKETSQKENIQSLERQIQTLTATLKTKDAEISFLKKTIDSVNAELRQNREKLSEELEKRGNAEKISGQLKSTNLELEYEIKFLRDKEESLTKRMELKEQQMLNLRKKIELDNDSLEKKLKNSIEYATSYQTKFNELQSLLSLKLKEHQASLIDIDRVRHENQGLNVTIQSLNGEKENLRRQIRDCQTQKLQVQLERDRYSQDFNRLRMTLNQKEDEFRRCNDSLNKLTLQSSNDRFKLQGQIKRYREEYSQLEIQFKEVQRQMRMEVERANRLERQLSEGGRQAQLGEIQVLKKINRDVSDITATNRQLEMKCLLLQNREKITAIASENINAYLLVQKYTDSLVDYLLKEALIPNLQLYHKFIADSRVSLSLGKGQQYFEQWQRLLKDLFQLVLSSRAEEMRSQAEQLLRLRDEMTEVLEKQIQVSEVDQSQLVQDYKTVLNDIKSLVKEFIRSGDEEYLRLLCNSLGIAA